MSNKTFKYVGISTLNGVRKLRYANDNMRIKVLERNGHKDVELIELPKALTKAEIEAGGYTSQFNIGVKNEKVRALADKVKIGASAKTETADEVTE